MIKESLLDSDIDITTRFDVEIDNMIRKWLMSPKQYVTVSTRKSNRRIMDQITYDDFEIKNHIIYFKDDLEITMCDVDDMPKYILFGHIDRSIHIFRCKCEDLSHIFSNLDNHTLNHVLYITIDDCPNLTKLPDMSKFKCIYVLDIHNNPKLNVDPKLLPKIKISARIFNNKNRLTAKDIKADEYVILSLTQEEDNKK